MFDKENRKQYLFVIRELTSREIKRKYARSYLGILWSVLNPLLSMAVLSMIFTQIFSRSIENYPIYYLTGLILWQLFTGATNAAMTTLVDNKTMLIKVKLPMEIFVLARVYTAVVNLGYSLVAYVAMLMYLELRRNGPCFFHRLFLFSYFIFIGLSYMLATAYVFFGDVKHLYSVVDTVDVLFGYFYPVDQLSGLLEVIVNNPIYNYIACLREVVMYGTLPSLPEIVRMVVWAGACILSVI